MARFPKGRKVVPTCPGDRYATIYRGVYNENGHMELVEDGKEDIKEKINSYRDGTDMSYILKQLSLGNTEVVNANPGMYGDFTKIPNTMQGMYQMMLDAERTFLELPVDIRNNFNHDFKEWLANAGSEDWSKKMNFIDEIKEEGEEVVQEQ